MQVIGRVLRPSHGKSQAIVLDHGGNVARFGFPEDIYVDKLDDGKPKKSDSERKEKEKEEPKPKECPQCKYLMRIGMKVCVGCGWHSKPKSDQTHTDDDLVEITKNGKKKPLNKTQMIASNPGQQILAQLKHRANTMGYKEGWVSYTYRDIFGHFPKGEDRNVLPMEPSVELLSWLRSQQIKKAKARSNGRW
jgi:superfamily II DNA or RNA helicase